MGTKTPLDNHNIFHNLRATTLLSYNAQKSAFGLTDPSVPSERKSAPVSTSRSESDYPFSVILGASIGASDDHAGESHDEHMPPYDRNICYATS